MRFLVATILALSSASVLGAPTIPTGLAATAKTGTTITLDWNDSAGATGYKIYRGGSQVGTSATSGFTVTGLTAGTEYSFTVSATNLDPVPESDQSVPLVVSTEDLPDAPLNLKVTDRTSTTVSLSWGAVAGATSYSVLRDGEEVDDVTGTSFTDTDLELSTTYKYTVTATTSGGVSNPSNEVTVTTFGDGSGKEAAFAKRFRQIDVDADGELTFDEYLQGHGGRLAWVVVKHRFEYSDTDDSQGLTLTEYAKALGGRKFMAPNKTRQFSLADIIASDGELQIQEYQLILPSRTKQSKIDKMFEKKDKDLSLGLSPSELGIRIINNPEDL